MTDPGRLTRMDEYPRHQVGGTFDSVVSDSVHWNDGFYFTLGDADTGTSLFAALRLYPNTDVLDGFACVIADGRQHNARWSRRLRPAIDDLAVGSLRLEILEPLARLRLSCADNASGISFDLDWAGLHEPYLEDRIVRYSGGRKVYDRTNFDQCCAVSGTITVGWPHPGGHAGHVGRRALPTPRGPRPHRRPRRRLRRPGCRSRSEARLRHAPVDDGAHARSRDVLAVPPAARRVLRLHPSRSSSPSTRPSHGGPTSTSRRPTRHGSTDCRAPRARAWPSPARTAASTATN